MSLRKTISTLGNEDNLTPMQVAEDRFLSRQEKIDRLNELKAIATGAVENDEGYGFTPEEIDVAIEHVKAGAQEGDAFEPVISPRAAMR